MAQSMRVYIVREPGGGFQRIELPDPIPRPNRVLVKICGSGANPLDIKIRAGKGMFTWLPLTTGKCRTHHGEILTEIGSIIETGKLKPLLNNRSFSTQEIAAARTLVESGS